MSKSQGRWILFIGISVTLILVVVATVAVEYSLPNLFVRPKRGLWIAENGLSEDAAKFGLRFTSFEVQTADHLTLKNWFVPALADHARGTVIILHGWCGRKEYCRDLIRPMVEHGYNAIAFDS